MPTTMPDVTPEPDQLQSGHEPTGPSHPDLDPAPDIPANPDTSAISLDEWERTSGLADTDIQTYIWRCANAKVFDFERQSAAGPTAADMSSQ